METIGDCSDAYLLPEEAVALGYVVDKRRREFTIARTCARRSLVMLGLPPDPILPGPNRQPLWPKGVVGSITHCADYCAAAVAHQDRFLTIGIDAEVHEPLPSGIIDMVTCDQERAWLKASPESGIYWDCVLFSAKESVFKAWFTITSKWLGFEDATICLEPDTFTFHARLLVDSLIDCGGSLTSFEGRYLVEGSLVLTAVAVENVHSSHAPTASH